MVNLVVIPLIGAFIGYSTNVVAIKMLFWPRNPINLGFFSLHGLLPKRQNDIAKSIGELVEEQLLSIDELFDQIDTPDVQQKIIEKLSEVLKDKLHSIVPAILPGRIIKLIVENLDKILRQEAPAVIRQVLDSSRGYVNNEVKVSSIVEDKINALDMDELEKMVTGISSAELRFIEILGGVLGFIIGLFQVGFLYLFPM